MVFLGVATLPPYRLRMHTSICNAQSGGADALPLTAGVTGVTIKVYQYCAVAQRSMKEMSSLDQRSLRAVNHIYSTVPPSVKNKETSPAYLKRTFKETLAGHIAQFVIKA